MHYIRIIVIWIIIGKLYIQKSVISFKNVYISVICTYKFASVNKYVYFLSQVCQLCPHPYEKLEHELCTQDQLKSIVLSTWIFYKW